MNFTGMWLDECWVYAVRHGLLWQVCARDDLEDTAHSGEWEIRFEGPNGLSFWAVEPERKRKSVTTDEGKKRTETPEEWRERANAGIRKAHQAAIKAAVVGPYVNETMGSRAA